MEIQKTYCPWHGNTKLTVLDTEVPKLTALGMEMAKLNVLGMEISKHTALGMEMPNLTTLSMKIPSKYLSIDIRVKPRLNSYSTNFLFSGMWRCSTLERSTVYTSGICSND